MAPPHETGPVTSIYLVSHGWHVGMVIRQADIPVSARPWGHEFPDAEYLEIGWGDRTFYQALDPHLGSALKAALLPTESVLHIFAFNGSVTANFPYSEIIKIRLPGGGMQRLAGYIASSFSRDDAGTIRSLGEKYYRNRRFYASRETYHLFNTCNAWTAKALRAAGLPVSPTQATTAEGLMSQARRIGAVVQSTPAVPSHKVGARRAASIQIAGPMAPYGHGKEDQTTGNPRRGTNTSGRRAVGYHRAVDRAGPAPREGDWAPER
jgi:uncharacterized protein (TIGR02117 family)